MTYKFEIRRTPGRAVHVVADVLLAVACFGALQTLETTATATAATGDASSTKPAGAFLSADLPASAEHSRGMHDTVVGDVEHTTASAESGDASLSITASTVPAFVTAVSSDELLYRKARGELLEAWSAESTRWEPCTHAGYDCRALAYGTGDGRKGMARLYLHDDALVVVNAVYTRDEEIAQEFLDSVHSPRR